MLGFIDARARRSVTGAGQTIKGEEELPHSAQYGAHERQGLDIYPARNRGGERSPVLVFIYGGGWDSGDRSLYRFLGQAYAAKGFTVVVPDYRIYPEVRYPDFMEDAALALKWVSENIGDHGGDAQCIHLMGHSAGAHIGALLALDPSRLSAVGLAPTMFRSFTGIAGPYSFNPLEWDSTRHIFETAKDIDKARPIKHAHGAAAPMLLLHPVKDKTVYLENSENLCEAITEAGGVAHHIAYPRVSHVSVIVSIAWPVRFLAPTFRDSLKFMRTHNDALPAEATATLSAFA